MSHERNRVMVNVDRLALVQAAIDEFARIMGQINIEKAQRLIDAVHGEPTVELTRGEAIALLFRCDGNHPANCGSHYWPAVDKLRHLVESSDPQVAD